MKRFLLFTLSALILAGCASTSKSPMSLTDRFMQETLVIANPSLSEVIEYERLDDFADTHLIQVNLFNKSNRPVQINYRIDWFNPSGFVVESSEPQRVRIQPNDFIFITSRANSAEKIHARVVIF